MHMQIGGVAHEPATPERLHIAVALERIGMPLRFDPIQAAARLSSPRQERFARHSGRRLGSELAAYSGRD